jgi:Spondin-like TSP1 domain/Thrombospondin type 1 domain
MILLLFLFIVLIVGIVLLVIFLKHKKVDCVVQWDKEWSDCSEECGGGIHIKNGKIKTEPKNGGKPCGKLFLSESCNTQSCDKSKVDCEVEWDKEWSACGKDCTQTKAGTIKRKAENGGKACPENLVITQACDTEECDKTPVDCKIEWEDWSKCSKSCGPGKKTKNGKIVVSPRNGGKECEKIPQVEDCNEMECRVDCVMNEWEKWSDCKPSCGNGTQTRTRTVKTPSSGGGYQCPPLEQTQPCYIKDCDQDCVLSPWSAWSECDQSCGGGIQSQTRVIIKEPVGQGKKCGALIQYQDCNTGPCKTDCVVGPWSSFSNCSKDCGEGTQFRTREITKHATYGSCPALTQTVPCNTQACPIDCKTSNWSNWSVCDQPCGGGIQIKTRNIITQPNETGKKCGSLIESQECNTQPCVPGDCVMGKWGEWGNCSGECGDSTKSRSRSILNRGTNNNCSSEEEEQPCDMPSCPVNCVVSDFSDWSECDKLCDGGEQTRIRFIIQNSENNGTQCPKEQGNEGEDSLLQRRSCNTQPCPVNCVVGKWGDWGPCSTGCGGGLHTRTRINKQPEHGGENCPSEEDTEPCNTEPCKVDCVLYDWSDWGECDKNCDGGKQKRTRNIKIPAANGGKECDSLIDTQECNTQHCPVQCVLDKWGDWSSCSTGCGGGTQTRHRNIITQPKYGANACDPQDETKVCNAQPCPVDCVVSDWSAWGECINNSQKRSRTISVEAQNNGKPCPTDLSQIRSCVNPLPMPIPDGKTKYFLSVDNVGETDFKKDDGSGRMFLTKLTASPPVLYVYPGTISNSIKIAYNWYAIFFIKLGNINKDNLIFLYPSATNQSDAQDFIYTEDGFLRTPDGKYIIYLPNNNNFLALSSTAPNYQWKFKSFT